MASQSKPDVSPVGVQATAVVTGSFLTGSMVCLSGVVVPVFLDTITEPAQLLHQWVRVYHYGHIYMPAICVGTCGLYGYAALSNRHNQQRLTYVGAAVTTLAMVPFTWIVMAPTNNTLFHLEASATSAASVKELSMVRDIVVRWSWLHLLRSVFPFLGVFLGFSAVLKEIGRL